jgi:hypothetical protein
VSPWLIRSSCWSRRWSGRHGCGDGGGGGRGKGEEGLSLSLSLSSMVVVREA